MVSPGHCRFGDVREPTADPADKILRLARTIAVVGLSANPGRPSYGVARYLQRAGYRIIPVNPNVSEVLGERAYATLSELPGPVDVVEVFRRSEFAGAIVDEAIAIGAGAVWLQDGVVDEAAAERARAGRARHRYGRLHDAPPRRNGLSPLQHFRVGASGLGCANGARRSPRRRDGSRPVRGGLVRAALAWWFGAAGW